MNSIIQQKEIQRLIDGFINGLPEIYHRTALETPSLDMKQLLDETGSLIGILAANPDTKKELVNTLIQSDFYKTTLLPLAGQYDKNPACLENVYFQYIKMHTL